MTFFEWQSLSLLLSLSSWLPLPFSYNDKMFILSHKIIWESAWKIHSLSAYSIFCYNGRDTYIKNNIFIFSLPPPPYRAEKEKEDERFSEFYNISIVHTNIKYNPKDTFFWDIWSILENNCIEEGLEFHND